jgi:hypothetical protein
MKDIIEQICTAHLKYFIKNEVNPTFLHCGVLYKDELGTQEPTFDVTIKMSCDVIEDEDDDIFYYCSSLEDVLSLCEKTGSSDFVIVNFNSFS